MYNQFQNEIPEISLIPIPSIHFLLPFFQSFYPIDNNLFEINNILIFCNFKKDEM